MDDHVPDLFNCLALIKGDLIVIIPNNRHDWEEGLSEIRKWWGEPLWIVWPCNGEKRSIEYIGRNGRVLLRETISPLRFGPYTPEKAIESGKVLLDFKRKKSKRKRGKLAR